MNGEDEVLWQVEDAIGTITLNAPHRMNTISGPMLKRLTQLLVQANEDKEVRAVILTGAGRAFCAGMNLEAQAKGTDNLSVGSGAAPTNIDLRNTPPPVLHAMDKPVICALNGSAAGYGLDLALGADIRIMGEKAKLAASYAKRGILPESAAPGICRGWSAGRRRRRSFSPAGPSPPGRASTSAWSRPSSRRRR